MEKINSIIAKYTLNFIFFFKGKKLETMLQNTMEGILTFYYMVSLPVWITIIAGTIVFCVFNRGNRVRR